MYNITREEAAIKLNMSTRSIDRYIRAGKLRSKKEGKIVYIHADDINSFLGGGSKKQEVIIGNINSHYHKESVGEVQTKEISKETHNITSIFHRLREDIKEKDNEIKELSIKIGKMEEVVKNSISMIEFKKTQFLLEESKNSLHTDLEITKKQLEDKQTELKEEKKLNYILIGITLLLFVVLIIVWLVKI